MMKALKFTLAAAVAAGATPACASDAGAGSSAAVDQPDIVITGQHFEYGARSTSTATKTSTDIVDIPQALTVVSDQQIRDQQLRSVEQLLNFVPGASYSSGEGNRDQIVLRGNSSTADFFIDGVRDDAQYFRDFYNVDRVEVLKGPNAMIFGRGGGGGIVNRVLKRPTLSTGREAALSANGWGDKRATIDLDQSLSNDFGLRLNGLYEEGGSFRNHVELKRFGINPTAALLVGSKTRIDFGYEYFHDRRTADRGVPADGDEPIRGFTRTFFGDPRDSFARADVSIATLGIEHDFNDRLTFRNRTLVGDYRKFYQNIYATGFNPVSGLVSLGAYNNLNNRKNVFSQTDLIWQNSLAGIDQTILFGFEVGQQNSRNLRKSGLILGGNTTPISDPTVDVNVLFASLPSDANNRVKANVRAAYVQDQLRPATWVQIVAGLRFDNFNVDVDDLRGARAAFERHDNLWSPRIGVILKPVQQLSVYASYSRSYLPQSGDQFSGLTDITAALKPERFDNYEVGAKWELDGGLLATVALYQLDRTNTRATDPSDPSKTVLTGAQRTQGLELGLERNVTRRWLVSGGYSLQNAEITQTTTAAPKGREVPLVPRNSFSLWNRYNLTKSVAFGVGLIARSKSYATISNAVKLPGYARADAALYYTFPMGLQAQLNVENLLGAHYFATANSDNNIAPGAPRTFTGTLSYRF